MKRIHPSSARSQHLGLLTVSAIASRFHVSRPTVVKAIHAGRLPVYLATTDNDERSLYLARPADAEALWGLRSQPLAHDPELTFA